MLSECVLIFFFFFTISLNYSLKYYLSVSIFSCNLENAEVICNLFLFSLCLQYFFVSFEWSRDSYYFTLLFYTFYTNYLLFYFIL